MAAERVCNPMFPCRRPDPCSRCEAFVALNETDFYILDFYRLVADQYINQEPGATNSSPLTTPRLEGWEVILRVYDYPRAVWPWLIKWARTVHRLHRKIDVIKQVEWIEAVGKPWGDIRPDDLRDPDGF